jgi:hypothetical protein
MAQAPRSHSIMTLVFLLALGLFMAACEQGETPVGYVPREYGSLLIEAGAEGSSSWVLVAPDGTEVHGEGDTLITAPQEGDWWLLWEPVEAWHSPQDNPARLSYKRGDVTAFAADYEPIAGPMGTLRIDPAPDEAEATWNLYGPNGFFAAGRGAHTLARRATGGYTVIWESVDGFVTPPQSTGDLAGNATLTLNADYQPVSGGAGEIDIMVEPQGLHAPWQLQLSDGSTWSGYGTLTLPTMPVGDYTVTWGDVNGYASPEPESASLAHGERLVFRATYEDLPDPVGSITVDVTPDGIDARWVLTSREGARFEGVGDQHLEGIPTGVWTLTPEPVDGYLAPTPSNVLLAAGWDIVWDLTYVAESAPVGALQLDPNPDALTAPWQLLSPSGLVASGEGDQRLENLPVGDYEVLWADVEGYATPERSAVSIIEGATTTATVDYELLPDPLGSIVIDPNPDAIEAPWQVTLPGGSVVSGAGDSTLVDMPMGEYTLTWGEVEGWETPSPASVTQILAPGGTALFSMR